MTTNGLLLIYFILLQTICSDQILSKDRNISLMLHFETVYKDQRPFKIPLENRTFINDKVYPYQTEDKSKINSENGNILPTIHPYLNGVYTRIGFETDGKYRKSWNEENRKIAIGLKNIQFSKQENGLFVRFDMKKIIPHLERLTTVDLVLPVARGLLSKNYSLDLCIGSSAIAFATFVDHSGRKCQTYLIDSTTIFINYLTVPITENLISASLKPLPFIFPGSTKALDIFFKVFETSANISTSLDMALLHALFPTYVGNEPLLVLYSSNDNTPTICDSKGPQHVPLFRPSNRSLYVKDCALRSWIVETKLFDDRIVEPRILEINFCKGSCPFSGMTLSTKQAVIRNKLRLGKSTDDPYDLPKSSCVAAGFLQTFILYLKDKEDYVIESINDLVVTSCICG